MWFSFKWLQDGSSPCFFCLTSGGCGKEACVSLLMGQTGGLKNWLLLWWAGLCSVKLKSDCLLMGVACSLLVGCLAWNDLVLDSTGSMVGLMATSKRTHVKWQLPGLLPPVPLSLLTHSSAGDPLTLTGRSGSVSCKVTSLLWVLVHTSCSLCPPRVEFLFPSTLCKSCNQIPLTFKIIFPEHS